MTTLTTEFLRAAWHAAGESISREIVETGTGAITSRLSRGVCKDQVEDFVLDALRTDYERWLRGGESRLSRHYAQAMRAEIERLLFEESSAIDEIREAVAARTGEELEAQP